MVLQVSLGLLGVISEVTFQCEPAFNLREILYNIPLADCLAAMTETAQRSEHVKWWVEMHSGLCGTFETNRTTEQPRDNPNHLIETILVSYSLFTGKSPFKRNRNFYMRTV